MIRWDLDIISGRVRFPELKVGCQCKVLARRELLAKHPKNWPHDNNSGAIAHLRAEP